MGVGLENDAVAGLDHLPAGDGVLEDVAAREGVPHRDAARAVDGGNLADLADGAAHGEVVAVVVVHVEEGVGQRAAGEGVGIGRVRAQELRYRREVGRLDGDALLLDELALLVDGPDALRLGVGGGHHGDVGYRAHRGVDKAAREPVVERGPDVGVGVPAPLHVHGGVVLDALVVLVVPALGRREERAPLLGVLLEPGRDRLVVLQRGIVVALALELLERLVEDEPDVVDALVDRVVEGGVGRVAQDVPGHAGAQPVDVVEKGVHAVDGVGVVAGVDLVGGRDGLLQEGPERGVAREHGLQVVSGLGVGGLGLAGLLGRGRRRARRRCRARRERKRDRERECERGGQGRDARLPHGVLPLQVAVGTFWAITPTRAWGT